LAFTFAIVLLAAKGGLKVGLIAAVAASAVYNLLLSDPVLRFGVRSIDDLMPLLAFNISAIASGYVTGRLRDEARTSQIASARVRSLLTFSQNLQTAFGFEDLLRAAKAWAPTLQAIEIHADDGRLILLENQPSLALVAAQMRAHEATRLPAADESLVLRERFSHGEILALSDRRGKGEAGAQLAVLIIAAERLFLTEQLVKTDILRRAEEFKTTLLSSVSHDLRTPLSIISASAGSLLRYRESLSAEAQQDLLETVEQQAARLNHLTSNLLSLGRIEGGLDPTRMPEIDAVEVLGSALVLARQLAPDRDITKLFTATSALVRADPALLEQVFLNVLENADVHTPLGSAIHVTADRSNDQVVIAVEDDGPGVPNQIADLIFERFYQGPVSRRPKRGSGLGLSIARGFLRVVGGDIDVGPRESGTEGARFQIRLPLSVPVPK
jgi:two-component system sensor histidine kinase KdpD